MATLQTLDRGITALKLIAEAPGGLPMGVLAEKLEIHKAIAYRIVATLELHGLVRRKGDGQILLAAGTLALASNFTPHFRSEAARHLEALTFETGCASCVAVAEADDCVILQMQEAETGSFRISYRLGIRHPLTVGAIGLAILAGRPESAGEPEAVTRGRRDGYVVTSGQLEPGVTGLARPVLNPEDPRIGLEPCVAVMQLGSLDINRAATATATCAKALRALLASS